MGDNDEARAHTESLRQKLDRAVAALSLFSLTSEPRIAIKAQEVLREIDAPQENKEEDKDATIGSLRATILRLQEERHPEHVKPTEPWPKPPARVGVGQAIVENSRAITIIERRLEAAVGRLQHQVTGHADRGEHDPQSRSG